MPSLCQQELDAASLSAFYETTVKEDCLRLKLCDMPLALCGPLFNAVADSRQLSALVLDMDSAREAVWEKVGLWDTGSRPACKCNRQGKAVKHVGHSQRPSCPVSQKRGGTTV